MIYFDGKDKSDFTGGFKLHRPVFMTGVLNDWLGYSTDYWTAYRVSKNNKHFSKEVDQKK